MGRQGILYSQERLILLGEGLKGTKGNVVSATTTTEEEGSTCNRSVWYGTTKENPRGNNSLGKKINSLLEN